MIDDLFRGLQSIKTLGEHEFSYTGNTYNNLLRFHSLKDSSYLVCRKIMDSSCPVDLCYNVEFEVKK